MGQIVSASSTQAGSSPNSAIDGQRFGPAAWKASPTESTWIWTVQFSELRPIGAVLSIHGEHDFALTNAALNYRWEGTRGQGWEPLLEIKGNTRIFRVDRFDKPHWVQGLRLVVTGVVGQFPTLREAEFYPDPASAVPFPNWIAVVNSTHERTVPGHGQEFIPLARSVPGWEQTSAQQIHVSDFNPAWLEIDPKPLAAFLSGSFKDWCEVNRSEWRGAENVLKERTLPIWASCGGAQALAILADRGADQEWDCPHCRDPKAPKLPIYSHIGHTSTKPCGDYSGCIFERGPFEISVLTDDPVFTGLESGFRAMQSHCGQIEYAPPGWKIIAGAGQGTLTKVQTIRLADYPIYAAQYHIEMAGTPENSSRLMSNFLTLALARRNELAGLSSKLLPIQNETALATFGWARQRQKILGSMQEVMGRLPGPEKRCDLDVITEESFDAGEFWRQKISYQSEPGARVPAYLLIPKTASAKNKSRAVLTLHQTHAAGYRVVVGLGESPNDEYAVALAKLGYVCLAPAYPLLAGHEPKVKEMGWESGTLKAVWDNMRGLDLLDSLPYVKTNGYAAIGHSLGGHNSLYTAAFDTRIKAVVTSCGFDSFVDYKDGDITGWTSERYMPKLKLYPRGQYPFDFQHVLAAIAPRALFINAPAHDSNFKAASVHRIADSLQPIYEATGRTRAFEVHFPEEGHVFSPDQRELAYWFIGMHTPH